MGGASACQGLGRLCHRLRFSPDEELEPHFVPLSLSPSLCGFQRLQSHIPPSPAGPPAAAQAGAQLGSMAQRPNPSGAHSSSPRRVQSRAASSSCLLELPSNDAGDSLLGLPTLTSLWKSHKKHPGPAALPPQALGDHLRQRHGKVSPGQLLPPRQHLSSPPHASPRPQAAHAQLLLPPQRLRPPRMRAAPPLARPARGALPRGPRCARALPRPAPALLAPPLPSPALPSRLSSPGRPRAAAANGERAAGRAGGRSVGAGGVTSVGRGQAGRVGRWGPLWGGGCGRLELGQSLSERGGDSSELGATARNRPVSALLRFCCRCLGSLCISGRQVRPGAPRAREVPVGRGLSSCRAGDAGAVLPGEGPALRGGCERTGVLLAEG